MLSRLCRSISRTARYDNQAAGGVDNQTRNLNTIKDDNNYTRERLIRVIRSYFFVTVESEKRKERKIWGKDPVIQESVRKIAPFISEMDPDALHLLIVNFGLMSVFNAGLWRDIETNFLSNSHNYLPPSQLVSICEAFDNARRSNNEIWTLLAHKVNTDIYSVGQLEPRDVAKLFKAFVSSGHEPDELMRNIISNIKATLDNFRTRELFIVLEFLSFSKLKDPELINAVNQKALDHISNTERKSYFSILKSNVRLNNSAFLDQIEDLYIENKNEINVVQLSSLILSYCKDELYLESKRKNFVQYLVIQFETVKSANTIQLNLPLAYYEAKVLYASLKFGLPVDKKEALRIFNLIQGDELEKTNVLRLKSNIETELKAKEWI
jgi:hypothetical protein